MIAYGISGGAFYLRAQMAAVYLSHSVFNRIGTSFIGTSAGAIISFVSAVRGVNCAWKAAQIINPANAITNSPFTDKGQMRLMAKLRAFAGLSPVKQSVTPILDKLVSNSEFEAWQTDKKRINCFVTTCNIETGERAIWDLSKMDKENAFLCVEGSARMQGMTDPVLIDGCLHWDGGQIDHNPAHLLFDLPIEFSKLIAVWSRPKDWKAANKAELKKSGYFDRLFRMIELDNIEKSLNDEQRLIDKCESKGIKPIQIYIDRVLAHFYDSSELGQNNAVNAAIKATENAFKFVA